MINFRYQRCWMINLNKDLIISRFNKLDEYLNYLREIRANSKKEFMSNFNLFLSSQRALETCINICIDIGNHILSIKKLGKAETYSDIFVKLSNKDLIDKHLKDQLIKMVKFRNLLGHLYMEIDNEIIYDILQNDLEDFANFKKRVYSKFRDDLEQESNG